VSLSPLQALVVFVLVIVAFLAGISVGSIDDQTEVPPTRYVKVLSGDFDDVPLIMESTSGTFRFLCDMHFTPEPGDEHSAECEYAK
jgi:hypothetical protein